MVITVCCNSAKLKETVRFKSTLFQNCLWLQQVMLPNTFLLNDKCANLRLAAQFDHRTATTHLWQIAQR